MAKISSRTVEDLDKKWKYQGHCVACGRKTDWRCQECAMYASRADIWLCPSKPCREIHSAQCGNAVAAN